MASPYPLTRDQQRARVAQKLADARTAAQRSYAVHDPGLGAGPLPVIEDALNQPPRGLRADTLTGTDPEARTARERFANALALGQGRGSGTLARPLSDAIFGTGYGSMTGGSAQLPNAPGESSLAPADIIPGLGEVLSAASTPEAVRKRDMLGSILGVAGAIGLPGIGKGFKAGEEIAADVARPAERTAADLARTGAKAAEPGLFTGTGGALKPAKKAKVIKGPEPDYYDPYQARAPGVSVETPVSERPGSIPHTPVRTEGTFDYSAPPATYTETIPTYVPARGTPQRTVDLLGRKDVQQKTMEGIERGLPLKDWYETGPLRQAFLEDLGPVEGPLRFEQFIKGVGATSPRSDVGTNVRNASYYYTLMKQGLPLRTPTPNPAKPGKFIKNEPPYGHLAQDLHRGNITKVLGLDVAGGPGHNQPPAGYDWIENPKPIAFTANLLGDPNRVAVDTHAFRAPAMYGEDPLFLERRLEGDKEKGIPPRNLQAEYERGDISMQDALQHGSWWQSKPLKTEYDAWQKYYQDMARQMGITPREAQAAGWTGSGTMTGLESDPSKTFMDFVEERLLKTQAERDKNLSPREILSNMIKGKAPLLSLAGAGVGVPAMYGGQDANAQKPQL